MQAQPPGQARPRVVVFHRDPRVQEGILRWVVGAGFPAIATDLHGLRRVPPGDLVIADVSTPQAAEMIRQLCITGWVLLVDAPVSHPLHWAVGSGAAALLGAPLSLPALETALQRTVRARRLEELLEQYAVRARQRDEEALVLQAFVQEGYCADHRDLLPGALRLLFLDLAESLRTLHQWIGALEEGQRGEESQKLAALIHSTRESVRVLGRTKQAFHSKELGELRKRLELLLLQIEGS